MKRSEPYFMNRKASQELAIEPGAVFQTCQPTTFAIFTAGIKWKHGQIQIYCVYYLFNHLSVAAEYCQWCAGVVRSDVIFLSTAHLHGEQVSLIMARKFSTFVMFTVIHFIMKFCSLLGFYETEICNL